MYEMLIPVSEEAVSLGHIKSLFPSKTTLYLNEETKEKIASIIKKQGEIITKEDGKRYFFSNLSVLDVIKKSLDVYGLQEVSLKETRKPESKELNNA